MNNTITGKYNIDRSNGQEIIIKELASDKTISLVDNNEKFEIEDCYVARIEELDKNNPLQSYIQYTDLNGVDSEVVLSDEDFKEVEQHIELSKDYCVLKMKAREESHAEDTFFAYIDLADSFANA